MYVNQKSEGKIIGKWVSGLDDYTVARPEGNYVILNQLL